MVLLGGAIHEKVLENDGEPIGADVYNAKRFSVEYRDILASILLLGPAKCPVPPYLARHLDVQPLLEAELAEVVPFDRTGSLQSRAARLYDKAYSECRKLEYARLTSPLISFDDQRRVTRDEYLDAETSIGEYEHYLKRLEDLLKPLLEGLRSIFGYYLDANTDALISLFSDLNSDLLGRARQAPDEPRSLFEDMELYLPNPLRLDRRIGRQEFPSYNPGDLENFWELDARLAITARDWDEHVDLGLQLGLRGDPHQFLRVHCFWRSFFDLMNLLYLSEVTGDPLFLPSNAHLDRSISIPQPPVIDIAEQVRAFRLVMAEKGLLPNPQTISDVLRMRDDQRIKSLRQAIREWSLNFPQLAETDADAVNELRERIEDASRAIRKARFATRAGTLVGCVALPVAAAEYLTGAQLGGIALAPIGPAVALYAQLKVQKASWVKLGL